MTTSFALAAAERLEAALERLLGAIEAREAARAAAHEAALRDMVPRAEVEALSARLDDALARLRAALQDQVAADQPPGRAEP